MNYALGYTYYEGKSHQAEQIGNHYYRYDLNGNVTEVREGGHRESGTSTGNPLRKDGKLRSTNYGIGLDRGDNGGDHEAWSRQYEWDEENRLIKSIEGDMVVNYRYGADGQRTLKYSPRGETLYFDSLWQAMPTSDRVSKHIYVGKERVATRIGSIKNDNVHLNKVSTYYYHSDHIGSAQFITDWEGGEYERIEYTPYGELWIEKTVGGVDRIPFRFTGKELDEETGLYYYGARYLDPKTSRWLSADPAMGEYVPGAPVNDEVRKRNSNLPGMGGVYNLVNMQLYHYAGNNPVKYMDPDGRVLSILLRHLINEEMKRKKDLNEFMSFLHKQGVERTDTSEEFKFEKIADDWENLPDAVKNYKPESLWSKFVGKLGLHNGKQQRLPDGYHIAEETTADGKTAVYVHHDIHDPMDGPEETIEHNKTEVKEAPNGPLQDKVQPNWEDRNEQ